MIWFGGTVLFFLDPILEVRGVFLVFFFFSLFFSTAVALYIHSILLVMSRKTGFGCMFPLRFGFFCLHNTIAIWRFSKDKVF